ncbi:hypothetical protein F5Y01DRAFT_139840 [Xylaria sp. FL0043]|nr:hypothetical protein F5Y01DRAFT_139840 [Xylaria sp. FL0043]
MFTILPRLIRIAHQSLLVLSLVQLFLLTSFIFETYTRISGWWSHGQLAAALIWVPLGVKLVYYVICRLYPRLNQLNNSAYTRRWHWERRTESHWGIILCTRQRRYKLVRN